MNAELVTGVTGVLPPPSEVPVLSLREVRKTFVGTQALKGVDLDIRAGEIHALVGANGSGKSTLIKTLAGYHAPDPGCAAQLNGRDFTLGHRDAEGYERLRFVHQDLGLVLEMSAVENMALTAGFLTSGPRVQWRAQAERTAEMIGRLGVDLDIHQPLSEATPVERTVVAIAAALTDWDAERGLLVLDEPTAVLPHTEVGRLLDIVREVRGLGASVLYVSHRLDEIFAVADRVTVLRDGRVEATRTLEGLDTQSLAELMVGESVDAGFRLGREPVTDAPAVLEVRGLACGTLKSLDLSVAAGEIVGIAGFAGSGAEAASYALAAGRRLDASPGEVRRNGGPWRPADVALSEAQFPLVPADRVGEAVLGEFSVAENLTVRVIRRFSNRWGWSSRRQEADFVDDWISRLEIKVAGPDAPITSLSGGNQQKVILGRCLASDPEVVILAEPTAGVDVGTRQAIYELVGELANRGLAVIVTSTDTTDLLALCSRVVVLSAGRVCSELVGGDITEQNLLAAMEAEQ